MMAMRRHEGLSRRKTKANKRTNARDDDLHIARAGVSRVWENGLEGTNCRM
jgi:hypothetical protein